MKNKLIKSIIALIAVIAIGISSVVVSNAFEDKKHDDEVDNDAVISETVEQPDETTKGEGETEQEPVVESDDEAVDVAENIRETDKTEEVPEQSVESSNPDSLYQEPYYAETYIYEGKEYRIWIPEDFEAATKGTAYEDKYGFSTYKDAREVGVNVKYASLSLVLDLDAVCGCDEYCKKGSNVGDRDAFDKHYALDREYVEKKSNEILQEIGITDFFNQKVYLMATLEQVWITLEYDCYETFFESDYVNVAEKNNDYVIGFWIGYVIGNLDIDE